MNYELVVLHQQLWQLVSDLTKLKMDEDPRTKAISSAAHAIDKLIDDGLR